jgi:pimeloyl-ACP methyl ester carboxylesterase
MILRSDDADLYYEVKGEGPDVVMLHPYPSDHTFWLPMAQHLESRFRGLGRSEAGEGPTTMPKLAEDLLRLCDTLKIGRAAFMGCSVGGYLLFEFWRRSCERVKALVLMDTRAGAETDESREGRMKTAEEILQKGPEWAFDQMMPRMLAPVTISSRLDVVACAKATMRQSGAAGMAAMQRGMAVRSDSVATLAEIDVPTLVLGGEADAATPVSELERMARGIRGAELKIVSRAGHYAALEQPEEVGRVVREFLDRNGR